MSRAAVLQAQLARRGLGCACVKPDELPEHQRLAAGAGGTGTGSAMGVISGVTLGFGLAPVVLGAGIGALVGGKKHRGMGALIGGGVGLVLGTPFIIVGALEGTAQ